MQQPDRLARAGFHHLRGLLHPSETVALAAMVEVVAASHPFVTPVTPGGKVMRCAVTGAGASVWHASKSRGYHYARKHSSGKAWGDVPGIATDTAKAALVSVGLDVAPFDSMLLTRYRAEDGERLGLHVDEDEADCSQPIVVVSLGADALFALGGPRRDDPVKTMLVSSGDVVILSGAARSWHHGVRRVMPVLASPLRHGERVSVSLRCGLVE